MLPARVAQGIPMSEKSPLLRSGQFRVEGWPSRSVNSVSGLHSPGRSRTRSFSSNATFEEVARGASLQGVKRRAVSGEL